jgi:hypothetical protein
MASDTVYTFSVDDFRAMMLVVINATTTAVPLIDSFRVRRIGYSALLDGASGSANVTFAWEGPNVPDISDTSFVGVGVPITRSYYPPPQSSAGWWYDNGATSVNLFSISQLTSGTSGEANVYLDLDFEYIIQNGAQTTVSLSINATFTGIAYARLPRTTSVFEPVSLVGLLTA